MFYRKLSFLQFFSHVLSNQKGNIDLSIQPAPPAPNPNDPPAPNPNPNDPPQPPMGDPGSDRYKRDMLRYKQEKEELEKRLENLKLQGHKEKEDWKAVAEHHENEAKSYKTKYEGLSQSLVNEKKYGALRTEAQKAGINPAGLNDLELLDFDEVTVETTSTGKIIVSGADLAIANLKRLRPHWFTTPIPGVNPTTPQTFAPNGSLVTMADLNQAEANWKKSMSESDKKIYYDLIQRYKSQPRG